MKRLLVQQLFTALHTAQNSAEIGNDIRPAITAGIGRSILQVEPGYENVKYIDDLTSGRPVPKKLFTDEAVEVVLPQVAIQSPPTVTRTGGLRPTSLSELKKKKKRTPPAAAVPVATSRVAKKATLVAKSLDSLAGAILNIGEDLPEDAQDLLATPSVGALQELSQLSSGETEELKRLLEGGDELIDLAEEALTEGAEKAEQSNYDKLEDLAAAQIEKEGGELFDIEKSPADRPTPIKVGTDPFNVEPVDIPEEVTFSLAQLKGMSADEFEGQFTDRQELTEFGVSQGLTHAGRMKAATILKRVIKATEEAHQKQA